MGLHIETTLAGRRWSFDYHTSAIVLASLAGSLMLALLLPALVSFLRGAPFPIFRSFLAVAPAYGVVYWLRQVARRETYVLYLDPAVMRWGWSHDVATQEEIDWTLVREVWYRPRPKDESNPSAALHFEDGSACELGMHIALNHRLMQDLLAHILERYPRVTVRTW